MTQEEYRDTVPACMDGFRKAKAHLKLNLVKDMKGNKKGFYKYIGKRKTRENMALLLNGTRNLVQKDMEKAEVVTAFLSLY